jgi:pimeloyl-ACP methyl ester carboxylesterase
VPTVSTNGISLYYEEHGTGPPVVLVSGLGASHLSWAGAVPILRERFRCITPDNRGTGMSDTPPGPYTIDAMADDIAGLISHLGVAPVRVVGWSLGGSVAQSLLINHGDLVDRAVLVAAFPSYTPLQHAWLDASLALRQTSASDVAKAAFGMPWVFTPRHLSDHQAAFDALRLVGSDPHPTSLEAFQAQAAAIRSYDSRAHLPGITTPTLILVGAEDVLTPVAQSIEMAALIPKSTLTVLPRGGHGLVVEYMEDTLREVMRFLS